MQGVDPGSRDQACLQRSLAWVSSISENLLDVSGADRVRFLHNLTTCDVAGLAVGGSVRGFVGDVQGRVLADADVVAIEDRLRLRLPAGRGEPIAAHFLKYRIAERVEVEPRAELGIAELRGERAPGLLATLGVVAPAARGAHAEVAIGGAVVRLRSALRGREPRFELVATAADLARALAALRGAGRPAGLVEPSEAELEAMRIEDGELRWGVDYDGSNFPQETGELEAISTTKGCYLGQEVVARIHFRGQVQRVARGLRFEGGPAPMVGEELLHEGRAAARATSVADSPALGAWVGLALVHRRAAEPGTRLVRAGGGTAEIVALPFQLPDHS